MSYVVFDVETTINSSFKRKANPFDSRNWVVYTGHSIAGAPSVVTRYLHPAANAGWLAKLLSKDIKLLVGFNIKFDILHAIVSDEVNYKAYMKWVAQGGNVWDCQLAEYLLNGMTPDQHMLSLDEAAPRYGGDTKIDEVKALWEAGIDTPDIPEDLLTEYLHGDVSNTNKIFRGQLERARACGQVKSILLNMGSLLFTIEAEKNGMAADKELGLELAKELASRRDELDAKLVDYLPEDLPFEFNWGNRYHLSPLIFGGKVKYRAFEYDLDLDTLNAVRATKGLAPATASTTMVAPTEQTRDFYAYPAIKETHYLLQDGTTIPKDETDQWLNSLDPQLTTALPNFVFVKSGKSAGQPKTVSVSRPNYDKPKGRMVDVHYQFPGFTEPDAEWASSTEGLYSVAGEVIEALGARDIPFLKDLGERAKVNKDLTTYFITTDPKTGEQKGMLTLVQPDGIIHHSINHTSTVTGRFSSSNPNLQNLPKGNKSKVKQVFRSRFPGGKIVQSDFSALEIYIQAILTGDNNLIADLKQGLDMHCRRVAETYSIPYEEALHLCKATNPDGSIMYPEWDSKRTKAKIFSFQRAYGAGAALIAAQTGMTVDEVKALIAAEEVMYPEIEPYYDRLAAQVEASKRGVRKVVPHPNFPAHQVELRTGYHRTPDNKLYAWLEQPAPKFVVEREGRWTGFSTTELKNYEVQGGGAEWAKAAMWLVVRAFYHFENFGGKALLNNQVHDACYADTHPDVGIAPAALLHACMEGASELMETYFGWPLPVHVPSDTTWGDSMADENKIEGLLERAVEYRQFLRDNYIK